MEPMIQPLPQRLGDALPLFSVAQSVQVLRFVTMMSEEISIECGVEVGCALVPVVLLEASKT